MLNDVQRHMEAQTITNAAERVLKLGRLLSWSLSEFGDHDEVTRFLHNRLDELEAAVKGAKARLERDVWEREGNWRVLSIWKDQARMSVTVYHRGQPESSSYECVASIQKHERIITLPHDEWRRIFRSTLRKAQQASGNDSPYEPPNSVVFPWAVEEAMSRVAADVG